MTRFLRNILALPLLMLVFAAQAQITIEITGAGANRIPVAVANLVGESALPKPLTDVIRADLERSGLFRLVDAGAAPIGENAPVAYGDWKSRGADALLTGTVLPAGNGRSEVVVQLWDVQKTTSLGGYKVPFTGATARRAGHRVADFIYEKLTGSKGAFSTYIAYVVRSRGKFELQVAEADGENPAAALTSLESIISPTWSPDGGRLAYVSFEKKKPVVYVQNLATGQRTVVANFKGSNSAPAWSPDGNRLAVVLSKDGGSQLYVMNADGSGVRRLASSGGIDTEPYFSPDGQWIYFTSDRGGSPQIYRIPAGGGEPQRVTFEGSYNTSPRLSPDGKTLAFVTRNNGRFQVAAMDLASRQVQILTDTAADDSPSFSPNGRTILYSTETGGRGVLAAVSVDGRVKQRLTSGGADLRTPAWGPFTKN